jgi:hypothetical protein
VIEPEQLDIFIPLQRAERFEEWARLARENEVDVKDPAGVSALADWLRDTGRAPAGVSHEALNVLVACMHDYAGSAAAPRA